jgi:hypothetical protein
LHVSRRVAWSSDSFVRVGMIFMSTTTAVVNVNLLLIVYAMKQIVCNSRDCVKVVHVDDGRGEMNVTRCVKMQFDFDEMIYFMYLL